MNTSTHHVPDKEAIERNKKIEPEGERIRQELIDFLERNKIVTISLDTDEHSVSVDIVKLPPEIKPVLRSWGSIYVKNDPPSPAQGTPEPPKLEVDARQYESALKVWHAAVKKFTLPNEMPDADTLAAKISALAGPQNGQGWAEDAAMEIIRTLRPSDPHSWDANLPYVMARLESLSTVTGEARGCPMFYGPHECDLCAQKNIVRGSVKDGFGDLRFDWPVNEPFIYPNYIWRKHICGEAVKP